MKCLRSNLVLLCLVLMLSVTQRVSPGQSPADEVEGRRLLGEVVARIALAQESVLTKTLSYSTVPARSSRFFDAGSLYVRNGDVADTILLASDRPLECSPLEIDWSVIGREWRSHVSGDQSYGFNRTSPTDPGAQITITKPGKRIDWQQPEMFSEIGAPFRGFERQHAKSIAHRLLEVGTLEVTRSADPEGRLVLEITAQTSTGLTKAKVSPDIPGVMLGFSVERGLDDLWLGPDDLWQGKRLREVFYKIPDARTSYRFSAERPVRVDGKWYMTRGRTHREFFSKLIPVFSHAESFEYSHEPFDASALVPFAKYVPEGTTAYDDNTMSRIPLVWRDGRIQPNTAALRQDEIERAVKYAGQMQAAEAGSAFTRKVIFVGLVVGVALLVVGVWIPLRRRNA